MRSSKIYVVMVVGGVAVAWCESFDKAVAVCDALTLGAKASGFAATYDAVQGYMNTYAQLKPEPKNKFDPQAIEVLARGEFFGHMGYIAKEQTDAVRALARYAGCDLKDIAVQIVCTGDVGFKSVRLALIAAT